MKGSAAFFKHASGDAEEAVCFRWQTQQVQPATWVAGDWKRTALCPQLTWQWGPPQQGTPWVAGVCRAALQRAAKLDTSVQVAAGPDAGPGYGKRCLRDRCRAVLQTPVCSHAQVASWGEIKRAKHFISQKSPFFLAFLEIKGISPNTVFLTVHTEEIVLMCTLEICIKLAPPHEEEPYWCFHLHQNESIVSRVSGPITAN